jgi:AcrR family transcriptional regulator
LSDINLPREPVGRRSSQGVRRIPSQKRSLEKYEAILRACAAVLREQGYDGATTAKIAARAGVGRGTLYQYFPNRETLVATLAEAELDRLLTHAIDAHQARTAAAPLEAARSLLQMNVEFWVENRALLRVLLSEVPGVFQLPGIRRLEERFAHFARSLTRPATDEDRPEGLDRKLYVLTNSIAGFLFRLALVAPPEATASEITDELMAMLTGYLKESELSDWPSSG